jgi:hypothetical protein
MGMENMITKPPTVRLRLKEIDLCGWIGQAAPGDRVEYHRGFLALDILPKWTSLPDHERKELVRLSARARWAAEQGLVHLVQKRRGPDDFVYIAIARPKPKQPTASIASLIMEEAA